MGKRAEATVAALSCVALSSILTLRARPARARIIYGENRRVNYDSPARNEPYFILIRLSKSAALAYICMYGEYVDPRNARADYFTEAARGHRARAM